jgi:hypothetical protein
MSTFTGSRTFTMYTRVNEQKNTPSIQTVVTVDMDTIDDDTLVEYFMQQVRIKIAAPWRKAGKIPSAVTITGDDLVSRGGKTVNREAIVHTYTPDELEAFAAKMRADAAAKQSAE